MFIFVKFETNLDMYVFIENIIQEVLEISSLRIKAY